VRIDSAIGSLNARREDRLEIRAVGRVDDNRLRGDGDRDIVALEDLEIAGRRLEVGVDCTGIERAGNDDVPGNALGTEPAHGIYCRLAVRYLLDDLATLSVRQRRNGFDHVRSQLVLVLPNRSEVPVVKQEFRTPRCGDPALEGRQVAPIVPVALVRFLRVSGLVI